MSTIKGLNDTTIAPNGIDGDKKPKKSWKWRIPSGAKTTVGHRLP